MRFRVYVDCKLKGTSVYGLEFRVEGGREKCKIGREKKTGDRGREGDPARKGQREGGEGMRVMLLLTHLFVPCAARKLRARAREAEAAESTVWIKRFHGIKISTFANNCSNVDLGCCRIACLAVQRGTLLPAPACGWPIGSTFSWECVAVCCAHLNKERGAGSGALQQLTQ